MVDVILQENIDYKRKAKCLEDGFDLIQNLLHKFGWSNQTDKLEHCHSQTNIDRYMWVQVVRSHHNQESNDVNQLSEDLSWHWFQIDEINSERKERLEDPEDENTDEIEYSKSIDESCGLCLWENAETVLQNRDK